MSFELILYSGSTRGVVFVCLFKTIGYVYLSMQFFHLLPNVLPV